MGLHKKTLGSPELWRREPSPARGARRRALGSLASDHTSDTHSKTKAWPHPPAEEEEILSWGRGPWGAPPLRPPRREVPGRGHLAACADLRASPCSAASASPRVKGSPSSYRPRAPQLRGWGLQAQGSPGAGVGGRPPGAPGAGPSRRGGASSSRAHPSPRTRVSNLPLRFLLAAPPRPGPAARPSRRLSLGAQARSPQTTDVRTDARTGRPTGGAGTGPRAAGERPRVPPPPGGPRPACGARAGALAKERPRSHANGRRSVSASVSPVAVKLEALA